MNGLNSKGSLYIEMLVSIVILGVISASVMPLYVRVLSTTTNLEKLTNLTDLTQYVGNYVFSWAAFSPESKPLPLELYGDGEELELSLERRINQLLWAEPIISSLNRITDHYKASIRFFETSRNASALVRVQLWYDDDLDNILDDSEKNFSFSTIVTEKRNY
jgi:hypothetical protein